MIFETNLFFFFQCGQPIRRNTEKKSGLEKKAFHRLNQLIMPAELKIYFFSSWRDITEDKRHLTLISGHLGLWRRVIENGIFLANYVMGVIGASWKLNRALVFEAVNYAQ